MMHRIMGGQHVQETFGEGGLGKEIKVGNGAKNEAPHTQVNSGIEHEAPHTMVGPAAVVTLSGAGQTNAKQDPV